MTLDFGLRQMMNREIERVQNNRCRSQCRMCYLGLCHIRMVISRCRCQLNPTQLYGSVKVVLGRRISQRSVHRLPSHSLEQRSSTVFLQVSYKIASTAIPSAPPTTGTPVAAAYPELESLAASAALALAMGPALR